MSQLSEQILKERAKRRFVGITRELNFENVYRLIEQALDQINSDRCNMEARLLKLEELTMAMLMTEE